MANPTFNGTDLTDKAAQNAIGVRQVRSFFETLPSANGMYAQLHGTGGRPIVATGLANTREAGHRKPRRYNLRMSTFRA